MRSDRRFLWYEWLSFASMLAVIVVIVWLAVNEQLRLYIHPRYELFTIAMTLIGAAAFLGDTILFSNKQRAVRSVSSGQWLTLLMTVGLCGLLLITKPATLTTITASQRVINSGAAGLGDAHEQELIARRGSYEQLTVKDWASLLSRSHEAGNYAHKPVRVSGFISPSAQDPSIFFVSRFVISCCAVDARPVGVPVYQPDWRGRLQPDQWVEVSGEFMTHPQSKPSQPIVVMPDYVRPITQPEDPYEY